MPVLPSRGDVWLVDFDPVRGHEQGGRRPAVVVSVDEFNHGGAGLVVMLPVTTRDKRNPMHVPLRPPEGGIKQKSFVKCEDIRCVSKERLARRWGALGPATMVQVQLRLRRLLAL